MYDFDQCHRDRSRCLDKEPEHIDVSELTTLPGYVGYQESWEEKREREDRERQAAKTAFFTLYGNTLSFMRISKVWERWRIANLTCDVGSCHDQADYYQCIPSKVLFCEYHAKDIMRYRRKHRSQRSKERAQAQAAQAEFEQMLADQIARDS